MKKLLLMLVVLGLVAPVAMAAIVVSHSVDLGCGTCHTVHNAPAEASTGAPLWGLTLATTGTKYTGGVTGAILGNPSGKSLLCMTCHDGATTTGMGINDAATGLITTSTSHPVSFDYTVVKLAVGATLDSAANLATAGMVLEGGTLMECSTCHEVHGTVNIPKAIRGSVTDTNLMCNNCHLK